MGRADVPLAILGAPASFSQPLHVNRPNCGSREAFLRRVEDMLERRWFTNDGPYVQELEERIAGRVGVAHCVLFANATLALSLLTRASGLTGQVLMPSFTFVATANALLWAGVEPVFCDVDPVTWTLDPEACERAVGPATSAILGVHLYGRPCDTRRLAEVAARHGLKLFFDAAHAFGCLHQGRAIGSFGGAEVFSFHATKAFHTFEGGAVTTADGDLASRLRRLRNHGFRDVDDVDGFGINAKLPEVSAAMGLTNLEAFASLVGENRRVFEAYAAGLGGIPGVTLRRHGEEGQGNWHYVVVEVEEGEARLSRDQLLAVLVAEGVMARRYFFPGCHRLAPYLGRQPAGEPRMPQTARAAARVLVLPGGQTVTCDQARRVCEIVWTAVRRAPEVAANLRASSTGAPVAPAPVAGRSATEPATAGRAVVGSPSPPGPAAPPFR